MYTLGIMSIKTTIFNLLYAMHTFHGTNINISNRKVENETTGHLVYYTLKILKFGNLKYNLFFL